jgi:large subunit ribosomal protein L9
MKIILNQTVGGLGKIGETIDVADGYARNYLVPKGLAVVATKGATRDWDHKRAALAKKEAQGRADAQAIADVLQEKAITIKAKVGEAGKLYGSVTSKEIADAVAEQLKIEVDRKKIELEHGFKEVGEHKVTVKLQAGIEATITINVVESEEE